MKKQQKRSSRDFFWDEEGFSSVGMLLALIIAISLLFSAARVYEINSVSAEIQEVADVSALAAENVVGEFYLVASVCDAIVFTLSSGMALCLGAGIAASCTPVTAAAGKALLEAGKSLQEARNSFSQKAQESLIRFQRALPFLASAQAQQVMQANSQEGQGSYQGVAVLVPWSGADPSQTVTQEADKALSQVEKSQDELARRAQEAEDRAAKLKESKEVAYQHDSGSQSGYCMYERAAHLAGMTGVENPYFSSSATWSFSAALARAKVYYEKRYEQEKPAGNSLNEQVNSSLRKNFYEFASSQVNGGYVTETLDAFDAHFPLLPKNTEEMRLTTLYTDVRYPITHGANGDIHMHAWQGCPQVAAESYQGIGSIAQMEAEDMAPCPACDFTAGSMGAVAAASSSIDNGFEYHYLKVAEAAEQYEEAFRDFQPAASGVQNLANSLFDQVIAGLSEAFSYRIEVDPPGKFGAVVFITASPAETSAFRGVSSLFVQDAASLGQRAAISAATLVPEKSDEGKTVIASFLDGIKNQSGWGQASAVLGVADVFMNVWSGLLNAYVQGSEAVFSTVENALNELPLASESGLGSWASNRLQDLVEALGFEPPDLAAQKAVLVNSQHVLEQDDSAVSTQLLELKLRMLSSSSPVNNPFAATVSALEQEALQAVEGLSQEFVIATVELFGGAVSFPITVALPSFVHEGVDSLLLSGFSALKGLVSTVSGGRQWQ